MFFSSLHLSFFPFSFLFSYILQNDHSFPPLFQSPPIPNLPDLLASIPLRKGQASKGYQATKTEYQAAITLVTHPHMMAGECKPVGGKEPQKQAKIQRHPTLPLLGVPQEYQDTQQ